MWRPRSGVRCNERSLTATTAPRTSSTPIPAPTAICHAGEPSSPLAAREPPRGPAPPTAWSARGVGELEATQLPLMSGHGVEEACAVTVAVTALGAAEFDGETVGGDGTSDCVGDGFGVNDTIAVAPTHWPGVV